MGTKQVACQRWVPGAITVVGATVVVTGWVDVTAGVLVTASVLVTACEQEALSLLVFPSAIGVRRLSNSFV